MSVIWRIALFLVYYIGLILLGLITIYVVFTITTSHYEFLFTFGSSRITALVLLAWAGVCCFALMLALYLIKPLFSFPRSNIADNAVEVEEDDCPELFAAIKDIVSGVGTKMPKHVYLTHEVNACVFYNTSFWSIFLPVRKNLMVGLGLFEGMSTDELKAILAHEFGHFSQKSMKVGSSIYVMNQILYNLTNARDSWDKLLDSWCASNIGVFSFFGVMTRRFTNCIKWLNRAMYSFVYRSYLQLSRQMEFDADNISCQYIGTASFVSAMCKIEINDRNSRYYLRALNDLSEEGKTVDDVFEAEPDVIGAMPAADRATTTFGTPLTGRSPLIKVKSRVEIIDSWGTHPSIEERIANARRQDVKKTNAHPTSAWSLVSASARTSVSEQMLAQIKGEGEKQTLEGEELKKWSENYFATRYMPAAFRPYFQRDIVPFDIQQDYAEMPQSSPFNSRNTAIIDEYLAAMQDWRTLVGVARGEREVEQLSYQGRVTSVDEALLEEHQKYYEALVNKVAYIDKWVYSYVMRLSTEEQKKRLGNAYAVLFHCQHINSDVLPELMSARDNIYRLLSQAVSSSDMESLQSEYASYVICMGKVARQLSYGVIASEVGDDNAKQMLESASNASTTLRDSDQANFMILTLPNNIAYTYRSAESRASTVLTKSVVSLVGEVPAECDASTQDTTGDPEGYDESMADIKFHKIDVTRQDDNSFPGGSALLLFVFAVLMLYAYISLRY